jgi:putative ABC transport system permease protein
MNEWLNGFAFHIGVEAWVIFVAGFAALMIAVVTISFSL